MKSLNCRFSIVNKTASYQIKTDSWQFNSIDYALARASKISTAGNFLPSKNSRKAPPPVEI